MNTFKNFVNKEKQISQQKFWKLSKQVFRSDEIYIYIYTQLEKYI